MLVRGLGASWPSWSPVLDELARHRDVVAIDLPGFGDSPPLPGEVTIAALSTTVADFIHAQGLVGIDTVGSSMGPGSCSSSPGAESAATLSRSILVGSGASVTSVTSASR